MSQRLVILGAGYAGVRAALSVHRLIPRQSDVSMTLVERGTVHQLITELHRVAAGTLAPDIAGVPLLDLFRQTRIVHQQAEVIGIDTATRVVLTNSGAIPYDVLLISLGSVPDYHDIPGLAEVAFPLKSLAHAEALATRLHNPPVDANAPGRIVIGGAGWTGIELATEMRGSPTLPAGLMLRIVEAGGRILPGFPAAMVAAAQQALQRQGISLDLHAPVVGVDANAVRLGGPGRDTGELSAQIIIWTGGVRAPALLQEAGLPLGPWGRVRVDPFLQAEGVAGVYVAGDCACVLGPRTSRPLGPSAQLAVQQGEIAAYNIVADLRGGPRLPYRPTILGEAMSLGRNDGISIFGPLRLHGQRALAAKRAITLNYVRTLLGPAAAGYRLRRGL